MDINDLASCLLLFYLLFHTRTQLMVIAMRRCCVAVVLITVTKERMRMHERYARCDGQSKRAWSVRHWISSHEWRKGDTRYAHEPRLWTSRSTIIGLDFLDTLTHALSTYYVDLFWSRTVLYSTVQFHHRNALYFFFLATHSGILSLSIPELQILLV
jgi:hypothetical protein